MAHQDWDYKKDVIEDTWQPADKKQMDYIQKLERDLGKTPLHNFVAWPSRKEAAALIHDLHLEWLRSRGDAK